MATNEDYSNNGFIKGKTYSEMLQDSKLFPHFTPMPEILLWTRGMIKDGIGITHYANETIKKLESENMKNTKKQVMEIAGSAIPGMRLSRELRAKAVEQMRRTSKIASGSNGNSIDYLVVDDFQKEMRSNNKQVNKNLLLADLALLLIEATQPRSEVARAISHQRSMVVKRWGKAFQEVTELRTIMEVLVKKLVACEDTAMIAHTLSAIQAINTGDMLIADDDQIIQ